MGASRDINLCTSFMCQVWTVGLQEWTLQYPNLPQPFLTCTHRSNEEQQRLYMNSRNGKDDDGDGKIDESDEWRSNARPGQSKHNLFPSEAFDIAFLKPDGTLDWSPHLFAKFAAIVKPMGVEWGGDWKRYKDRPHFQQAR